MDDIEKQLFTEGVLSEASYARLQAKKLNPLFSLHWELRTILYLGVLLLTGGLGVLVYQNIDTIGHQAVLAAIAFGCSACFWYCFAKGHPFRAEKHTHENPFFDYTLLLGCLLFLTFLGYLQYQYGVFKTNYNVVALFPTVLFYFLAYRFDHIGILSMAITGEAAWVGITITPLHLLDSFDYASESLIWTGIALGISLLVTGGYFVQRKFKAHFFFTYANFAVHLLFVATLAGLFLADHGWAFVWFIGLVLLFIAGFYLAKREKSFYFLLISLLYSYVGLTYLFFFSLSQTGEGIIWVGFMYFIGSCAAIVYFLRHHKAIVARVLTHS